MSIRYKRYTANSCYHSGSKLLTTDANKWVWPETSGPKPSPRAAHSAAASGDKVYVFGGRFKNARMNDLHCLDLVSFRWSGK